MKPISIIIITYNRPDDMLALLQNITQLDDINELLEEVLIVNNASTSNYRGVKEYINATPSVPFKYINAVENLGVSKGRNYAIQQSSAPILMLLDDDAVLQNKDCLKQLVNVFENNNTEHPKAIVSFKVLYYDTLEMQKNALPHKQFDKYKNKSFFETYYYAGGAHAIKRSVIKEIGLYAEDFFYGMEEYDLSYRVLEAGYSIIYTDKIIMLHKESPQGRVASKEKLQMMWINKTKVAWRYLPKKYFYSTALMWSLQYLRKSKFDLKGFCKTWKIIYNIPSYNVRQTISNKTIQYLKKLKARLWY